MEYRFVTVWCIEAPIEVVCEAVSRSLCWPQWWGNCLLYTSDAADE